MASRPAGNGETEERNETSARTDSQRRRTSSERSTLRFEQFSSFVSLLNRFHLAQFDALNAELEHRRREQLEMKSKLQERVMQHENETDDVIANDAIEQAYQSQKQINKSDTFSLSLPH